MQVTLLTRKLDNRPTNGFERYALNLSAGLRAKAVEVRLPNQRSPFNVQPSGSLASPFYYDLALPALKLTTRTMDAPVVHALTDSQAFPFPFLKGKKVVTFHHVDKTPPGSPSEALFCRFYNIGTKLALKYADHFICISEQTRKEVMEAYGVPDHMITVVPQAIASVFCPHPGNTKGNIIGYIGALKKRKNVEMLIRSFARAREVEPALDLHLVLCGEGPDEARLKQLTKQLGIWTSVEFRGLIPEEQLVGTYNSFDVFAFPSLQEGFGFPILEAQACGIPVLTLEGALVPGEVAKYTLQSRGEDGMTEDLIRVLTDTSLKNEMIKNGLIHAADFSVHAMADRTIQVYERLIFDK